MLTDITKAELVERIANNIKDMDSIITNMPYQDAVLYVAGIAVAQFDDYVSFDESLITEALEEEEDWSDIDFDDPGVTITAITPENIDELEKALGLDVEDYKVYTYEEELPEVRWYATFKEAAAEQE